MMTHGAMLWGAALYTMAPFPFKMPRFGEIGMRSPNGC